MPRISRHTNASSGAKAHNDSRYIKVGRIRMNSWAAKQLSVSDVFISERELVHISNKHSKELQALGLNATLYVTYIASCFNEVRQDLHTGAYLLIVKPQIITSKTTVSCAVIELSVEYSRKKKIYRIKTAHPEKWDRLSKQKLVCIKPRA